MEKIARYPYNEIYIAILLIALFLALTVIISLTQASSIDGSVYVAHTSVAGDTAIGRCPKCDGGVNSAMNFCPSCGVSLYWE